MNNDPSMGGDHSFDVADALPVDVGGLLYEPTDAQTLAQIAREVDAIAGYIVELVVRPREEPLGSGGMRAVVPPGDGFDLPRLRRKIVSALTVFTEYRDGELPE